MLCQFQKLAGACGTSHELGNLHKNDRNSNATDKTAHNGCRDEIHNLICMEQEEYEQP